MATLFALVQGLDAELVRLGYKDATMVWTAPSFLEGVTSGKVGTHDITETAPR